jgi:hypothetical protein
MGPIESVPGHEPDVIGVDARVQPVAVVFDLVEPVRPIGRALDEQRELGPDPSRRRSVGSSFLSAVGRSEHRRQINIDGSSSIAPTTLVTSGQTAKCAAAAAHVCYAPASGPPSPDSSRKCQKAMSRPTQPPLHQGGSTDALIQLNETTSFPCDGHRMLAHPCRWSVDRGATEPLRATIHELQGFRHDGAAQPGY